MKATPGYWALAALTVISYGAMAFWTLPAIRAEAGGLQPFDLRPTGYSYDESVAFLTALSEEGLRLYGGPQAMLDAIYPGLLFATLGIALWALTEGVQRTTRIMLVAVCAIGMGADMFENMRVREMLIAGPGGVTVEMVEAASFLTVLKSAANTVAFLALGAILAVRFWQWRRG